MNPHLLFDFSSAENPQEPAAHADEEAETQYANDGVELTPKSVQKLIPANMHSKVYDPNHHTSVNITALCLFGPIHNTQVHTKKPTTNTIIEKT
jgi:hypothetical protein